MKYNVLPKKMKYKYTYYKKYDMGIENKYYHIFCSTYLLSDNHVIQV